MDSLSNQQITSSVFSTVLLVNNVNWSNEVLICIVYLVAIEHQVLSEILLEVFNMVFTSVVFFES